MAGTTFLTLTLATASRHPEWSAEAVASYVERMVEATPTILTADARHIRWIDLQENSS